MGNSFSRRNNPQANMSLVDHLSELRYRLLISLGSIFVCAIFCFWWYSNNISVHLGAVNFNIESVGKILLNPYCKLPANLRADFSHNGSCRLLAVGLVDQFMLRFKVSAALGALFASPVWFLQIWRFIAPGMRKNEKRYSLIFVLSATFLFLLGAVVAYLIVPKAFKFLLSAGQNVQVTALTGQSYFAFILHIFFIFGVSFELPLMMIILNFIGVLPAKYLTKWQRGIIFALFVFAAIVTPGQDPFSMVALAGILTILFELAVLISVIHDKIASKRRKEFLEDDDDQSIELNN